MLDTFPQTRFLVVKPGSFLHIRMVSKQQRVHLSDEKPGF
jgi:hypothetical protein